MSLSKHIFALSLLALPMIAACASTSAEPRVKGVAQFSDDARLGEQTNSACFASQVDNFSDTTRDTVVLEFGSKHYLVEVFGVCTELRRAGSIAVDASGSCLTKGDHLIVSDSVFGLSDDSVTGPQRCTVSDIYEWDPKAEPAAEAQ